MRNQVEFDKVIYWFFQHEMPKDPSYRPTTVSFDLEKWDPLTCNKRGALRRG